MDIKLIRMFNKALPGEEVDYKKIAEAATRAGYIVDPKCATVDVLKFLREQRMNPNSTFYKTWDDVVSKSRLELYLDQIKHYASTYGNAENSVIAQATTKGTVDVEYGIKGNGYVPNAEPPVVDYTKFRVIKAASEEEIRDDILAMFESGSAMSSDTIDVCIDFLKENHFLKSINIDSIKNKEAQTIIAVKTKKYPSDEFGLLRAIVYTYTGSAMLIKDRISINTIKGVNGFTPKDHFDFAILSERQLINLSRIFLRYKPLFLAMKGYEDNAKYVNKIRRLAEKHHKPMQKGFWETVLTLNEGVDKKARLQSAKSKISELNNFRKVQIMQSIRERMVGKDMDGKMYVIRNGKMFVREGYVPTIDLEYLMNLYNILKDALVESLKAKATSFYVRPELHLACPTSEKNFLGNYPMGTSVEFGDSDNVIGVYWRNEWGTRDFDLHVLDDRGYQFGWNSSYSSGDVIYSGDMTNADPEAAELFYFKKGVPDGVVNLNKYNGANISRYRLFVAKENMSKKLKSNGSRWREDFDFMCDPNNIVFEAMLDFNGSGQQTIAYLHNSRLYLMKLQSGYGRVSTRTNNNIIQQANKVKADSYIDLIPILEEAGFTRLNSADGTVDTSKASELKKKFELFKESTLSAGFSEEVTKVLIAEAEADLEKNLKELDENKSTEKAALDFSNPTKDMFLKLFA